MLFSPVYIAAELRRPVASFLVLSPVLTLPTLTLSPLVATLMDPLASVANKRLTSRLSPLDATLTKTIGGAILPNLELVPLAVLPSSACARLAGSLTKAPTITEEPLYETR